jgi:hypothetical protein
MPPATPLRFAGVRVERMAANPSLKDWIVENVLVRENVMKSSAAVV